MTNCPCPASQDHKLLAPHPEHRDPTPADRVDPTNKRAASKRSWDCKDFSPRGSGVASAPEHEATCPRRADLEATRRGSLYCQENSDPGISILAWNHVQPPGSIELETSHRAFLKPACRSTHLRRRPFDSAYFRADAAIGPLTTTP